MCPGAMLASVVFAAAALSISSSNAVLAFIPIGSRAKKSKRASMRSVTKASSDTSVNDGDRTVRILALHGKGGSGPQFRSYLAPLRDALMYRLSSSNPNFSDVVFDCPTAPHRLDGRRNGYAWWTLPPGVRSFDARDYEGFDSSAEMVMGALSSSHGGGGKFGPGYDFIFGHSQGAILLAALLATGRIPPTTLAQNQSVGYVLNGAAWPNPYSDEMRSFFPEEVTAPCQALFVIGDSDTINPPEGARRVRDALGARDDLIVDTCSHPGGHSVPVSDRDTLVKITDWMLEVLTHG